MTWTRAFDKMRKDIQANYPTLNSLPLLDRIKALVFGIDSESTLSWSDGKNQYAITAVLVRYKEVTYFKRFGRLSRW